MNSMAGPSRPRASLHIDLDTIIVDQPRYASPLSTASRAPSWRPERDSTQSAFSTETWGVPQTPRTERSDRSSLPSIHCSIGISDSQDDTVSYGGEGDTLSLGSLGTGNGKTAGWWIDLDKTPRPTNAMPEPSFYPSRLSSLPSRPSLSLAIPSTPLPHTHHDDAPLPDDSPTIPPSVLLPPSPSFSLEIPSFKSHLRPRIPSRPPRPDTLVTREFLALFPVPQAELVMAAGAASSDVASGPPPPIPPRRSSRPKDRAPSVSEAPTTAAASIVIQTTGPPPAPPPRASSLRSTSSRASSASASSTTSSVPPASIDEVLATATQAETVLPPDTSPVSLSRRPRVRTRTAPCPIVTRSRSRTPSAQLPTFDSRVSLASIVEDEKPNDLDEEPSGSWSLRERRRRSELYRARSQPHVRRAKNDLALARQISARPLCLV